MSNDIRDILQRLTAVEGRLTPVGVKSGLNQQQKSVPQLPALFKPNKISVLGANKDPKHPMSGYAVGADESVQPRKNALEEAMSEIEEDMLSKVKKDLTTYLDRLEKKVSIDRELKDKAIDAVQKGQAEEDLDEFAAPGGDDREPDEEEILRQLAAQWWNGTEQQMVKAQNTLAAMGWEIGPDESGDDDAGVYVYRIGDEDGRDTVAFAHSDLDLNEEIEEDPDAYVNPETVHDIEDRVNTQLVAPQAPIKTVAAEDGAVFEIHGDENNGFEIRHGHRSLPSRFPKLDHAQMAIDLYRARRKQNVQNSNQDYIEER